MKSIQVGLQIFWIKGKQHCFLVGRAQQSTPFRQNPCRPRHVAPHALLWATPAQAPLQCCVEQPPRALPPGRRAIQAPPLFFLPLHSLTRPGRRAEAFPAPWRPASPSSTLSQACRPLPAASLARVSLSFDGFPAKIMTLRRLRRPGRAPSSPASCREPMDATPHCSLM
jgi:hypothetical protein